MCLECVLGQVATPEGVVRDVTDGAYGSGNDQDHAVMTNGHQPRENGGLGQREGAWAPRRESGWVPSSSNGIEVHVHSFAGKGLAWR